MLGFKLDDKLAAAAGVTDVQEALATKLANSKPMVAEVS